MVQHWTTAGIAPYSPSQASPGRCNSQEEQQQHCTCCSSCPPFIAITLQGITCSCDSIHEVASRQHGFWPVHAPPSGLIFSLTLNSARYCGFCISLPLCASQFHISKGPEAQRTPLPVKLVLPNHAALVQRLELVASHLEGTQFAFEQTEGSVMVTDPFGQQFEVLAPSDDDTISRGIKEIVLPCAPGTAAAIGAFYEKFYMVCFCTFTTTLACIASTASGLAAGPNCHA